MQVSLNVILKLPRREVINSMPKVGKKHFSYSEKGKKAAKKYAKKIKKKVSYGKKK